MHVCGAPWERTSRAVCIYYACRHAAHADPEVRVPKDAHSHVQLLLFVGTHAGGRDIRACVNKQNKIIIIIIIMIQICVNPQKDQRIHCYMHICVYTCVCV